MLSRDSIISATLLLTLLTSCRAVPLGNSTTITDRQEHLDLDDNLEPEYGRPGDMTLPLDSFTSSDTRGVVNPRKDSRWPNGMVPYVIDKSMSDKEIQTIKTAMKEYESKTCVRFVPRTKETNYIQIYKGTECDSSVGMLNSGAQDVSLGKDCINHGIILHELGHVLGFYNEQTRKDRDKYVTIYWKNIEPGQKYRFEKKSHSEELILTPFDFKSIMLYGEYTFSKDERNKTMEAKDGSILIEVDKKQGLSAGDVESVKKMYNCE